jgi:hypothetical protein
MTRSRDVSKGATRNEFIYTATATQTTFSGNDDNSNSLSYTVGQIDVFMNGARLAPADFTATNGTSVVLDSGAAASDIIQINAFGTFSVTDVLAARTEFDYTATAGQTTFSGNDNDSQSLSYTAGRIDVYLNGSRLNVTDDYVATNGTSVVLQSGAQAGDSLVVVSHGTVNLVSNILDTTLDLNGEKLVLDADADTSIHASTDDQIDIEIAGADDFAFKANKFEVQTGSNIDMNGTELILDADGDTSITADTDDQIDVRIAGADDFQFTANKFSVLSSSELAVATDSKVMIGGGSDRDVGGNGANIVQIEGTTFANSSMSLTCNANATTAPTLRFGKSRGTSLGSNTVVQDGDELGVVVFAGADGTDIASQGAVIIAAVDGTPGGNDMPTRLQFNVTADGASSTTQQMRISANGRTDLGTGPQSNGAKLTLNFTSTTEGGLRCSDTVTSGTHTQIQFLRGGTQVGKIECANQSSTAYVTTSDYRMKENVSYSWDGTTRLKQLKPARFNFKEEFDSDKTTIDGFIAHEVSSIVPEAITGTKDATKTITNVVKNASGDVIGENIKEAEWTAGKAADPQLYPSDSTWSASATVPDYQGIDQAKLVPLLVKTVQEQQVIIENLQSRVTTLEG